jgi:hypothetical protein
MTLHKSTNFYTVVPCMSQHYLKIRTAAIFKSSVNKNNYSNETYRYVHHLLLYKISSAYVQRFMTFLHKTKCEF